MPTDPEVSVIVPTRDDLEFLRRSLPRIEAAVREHGDAELIVVDNGSRDGSRAWLEQNYGDVARILSHEDATIGAVRNHGAVQAGGEYLCFIDADCLVEDSHLRLAMRTFRETGAAAIGSRYSLPEDPSWVEATWHRLHRTGRAGYVRFLSAGNLLVRARAFSEVGGFDENLVTGEDAALCRRLEAKGFRIYQNPEIKAVHLGNPKTAVDFFRKQRWYALGMFGTVAQGSLDKPVAASIVHLVLLGLAPAVLLLSPIGSLLSAMTALALVVAVPAAATAYRWIEVGRVVAPIRAIILYELFFAARIVAGLLIMSGRVSGWRPTRHGVERSPVDSGREG